MLEHKYAEKQRTIDPERGRSMSAVAQEVVAATIIRAARILARRRLCRSRHAVLGAMKTTIDAQTLWLLESWHLGEVRGFGMPGRNRK